MKITLTIHEKMLLELLRSALQQVPATPAVFEGATEDDWKACRSLAIEQGVMALAWDGVTTLPAALLPPKRIKIKWALKVEEYEKRYQQYCRTLIELSHFYADHGIRTMALKGVGFSTYYPKPQHREGGDLDIYTFSANPAVMSDAEANELADQLMRDLGKEVDTSYPKHSVFTYQNIPIENHKTFLSVQDWVCAIPIEQELRKVLSPVEVPLLDEGKVLIPPQEFNTLFISFHAMRHYGAGISLHHLCDWATLLNRCGLQLPKEVTEKHYLSFVATLTAFTNRYLGTKTALPDANVADNANAVPDAEERLTDLLYQLFRSPYRNGPASTNPWKVFCYKVRYKFYYSRLVQKLAGESFIKPILHSLKHVIEQPSALIR